MGKPRSKVSIALRVPPELAREVREFVRFYAGSPLFLTVTTFGEAALRRHLAALREEVEGRSAGSRRLSPLSNHRR
jgi:hypothetical protein